MFGFLRKAKSEKDKELYKFLKNILGYTPENISIYKLALTHRSVSNGSSHNIKTNNERLEYLGDTVLSTVVADLLFRKYPYENEGFLTEMRSKIVSRSNLNKVSQKIGLSKLIQYNKDSAGSFKSIDGDAFEALIGAIYLEKGYRFTQKIIVRRIIKYYMDIDALHDAEWNFKSKVIDWGQKERKKVSFEVVDVSKHGGRKQYTVQVMISGEPYSKAVDYSIKAAEQLASEKTYKDLMGLNKVETA